jgi:TetR/AcrR family transcriptional regulator, regulator of cefoperazone and chloramphenicol sensitivity
MKDTRDLLLEAAGQVFAEKGYDAATGKEICERAGLAAAAVNYHFGGMQALYQAVIAEARSRLMSFETLSQAVAGGGSAEVRLRAVIAAFVKAMRGPAAASWVVRVLGRELTAPSRELAALEGETRKRALFFAGVVGEFMGLPADHPAVARGCVSVAAPCIFLLIADRASLKLAYPSLGLESESDEAWIRHMVDYALAGLKAAAAGARQA